MNRFIIKPSGRTEPPIPLPRSVVQKRFDRSIEEMVCTLFTSSRPHSPLDHLIEELLAEAQPPEPLYWTDCDDISSGPLRLRDGVDYAVEEKADDYLKGNKGIERNWLTKEQLALRVAKEVYCEQGFPDSGVVAGLYRRAYNPLSGQRPTNGSRNSDS